MRLVDILSPISATATAVVILLCMVYFIMKNRDILPGPGEVPYFGLFFTLKDETCHLQLEKLRDTYGDLFSFDYLGKLIINLGSVKAIREVHINNADSFAGRFTTFNILTHSLEDGVTMANGEHWKTLRKFFMQAFKEYGLMAVRDNTAVSIYDSVATAILNIKTKNGERFNVIELLTEVCIGPLKQVLFSEHIPNSEILKMNKAYEIAQFGMTGVKMLFVGPIGKLLFFTSPTLRQSIAKEDLLKEMLYLYIKKIEKAMDENHPTCITEDFYKERNMRRRNNDPTHKYFTDKSLVASLAQFVGDGMLSLAYFIGLFLNSLVEHPEEQDKIYKEIMEVVGPSRLPTVDDRSKLTYTNAFMNEAVRTSNFFSLFPSLECTRDVTIRGYKIPKGSITLLNIWAAHHDPQTYEEPYKFNPSRFIPEPGKIRPELPVQFGLGKRACIGEPYVSMQGFLLLTAIVKNFTISEPENAKSKSELFLMTGIMELCMHPRTES